MEFIDRDDELRRLDAALAHPGALAVLWGRRRVGKTRLLLEWSRRRRGLYAVADQSVPPVQRRYLAAAVDRQFPGFAVNALRDRPIQHTSRRRARLCRRIRET